MLSNQSFSVTCSPNLESYIEKIKSSQKYDSYVNKFLSKKQAKIISIHIETVKWFGPPGSVVGFIYADVVYENFMRGKDPKPDKAFLVARGGAVSALPIINGTTGLYVSQFRPGYAGVMGESMAGMLDEESNGKVALAEEFIEELGIKVNKKKFRKVGRIYTSPGLMDEFVDLYIVEITMTKKQLTQVLEKINGVEGTLECIRVKSFDIRNENFGFEIEDCKMVSLLSKYHMMLRSESVKQWSPNTEME